MYNNFFTCTKMANFIKLLIMYDTIKIYQTVKIQDKINLFFGIVETLHLISLFYIFNYSSTY